MYLNFYHLRQEPFHVTPDPEFWFSSRTHMEALSAIIYGIEQRKGFIAVTGDVGLGKTTIVRNYLEQYKSEGLRVIYVYDSDISFKNLLTFVFHELGLGERPKNITEAMLSLYEKLIESYRKNETVVLIIDEAQNLPIATLERLRMLSNLETTTDKLIQLVLIGQPEFNTLLEDRRLRQLKQRIAIRTVISPLGPKESVDYLKHRLETASIDREPVMNGRAMRLIAQAANGVPRRLNILSDNALITGYGYAKRPVTARIVREVIQDEAPAGAPRRRRGAGLIAAGLLAVLILVLPVNELIGIRLSSSIDRFVTTTVVPALKSTLEEANGWWSANAVANRPQAANVWSGTAPEEESEASEPCDPETPVDGADCAAPASSVRQPTAEPQDGQGEPAMSFTRD